jgi:hypothetical protein
VGKFNYRKLERQEREIGNYGTMEKGEKRSKGMRVMGEKMKTKA